MEKFSFFCGISLFVEIYVTLDYVLATEDVYITITYAMLSTPTEKEENENAVNYKWWKMLVTLFLL